MIVTFARKRCCVEIFLTRSLAEKRELSGVLCDNGAQLELSLEIAIPSMFRDKPLTAGVLDRNIGIHRQL